MWRSQFLLTILVVVMSGFGINAHAQSNFVEQCGNTLVMDTLLKDEQHSTDWRLSTLVTEDIWEKADKSASGNGSLYGVPIGATWKDYRENRTSLSNYRQEGLKTSFSSYIESAKLSNNALSAYLACLKVVGSGQFQFAVIGETEDSISVLVTWLGGSTPNPVSWTMSGFDDARGKWIRKILTDNIPNPYLGTTIIYLPRPERREMITANPGIGSPQTITLLPFEPAPPRAYSPCVATDASGRCIVCQGTVRIDPSLAGDVSQRRFTCPNMVASPTSGYSLKVEGRVRSDHPTVLAVRASGLKIDGTRGVVADQTYRFQSGGTLANDLSIPAADYKSDGISGSIDIAECGTAGQLCGTDGDIKWTICAGSTCGF